MINGHGDDLHTYNTPIISNFSSNVFNGMDLSGLTGHLYSQLPSICNYPEPEPFTLEQTLANIHHVSPGSVCVTNGATEAIYLIAQTFRECRSAILQPTFSEYEDACRVHAHTITSFHSPDNLPGKTDLIWICNPNNPTGEVTDKETLCKRIASHPDTCFVIDQAYEHFTTKQLFTVEEGVSIPNLILLHSMTKQYAIPGLRLGYFTAPEPLTNRIRSGRMPWSVNRLAIEAGTYLVENQETTGINIQTYLRETRRLKTRLESTGQIEVHPTDTHYMLCRLKKGTAAALKEYLANTYGYLIRDAANFKGLSEQHFRIATQTPEENNKLIEYIHEWFKQ